MSAAFHTADHSFLLETHSLHDFQNTHSPEFLLSSQTILCQGRSLTLGISREKSSNIGIDCKCTGKTGGARRRKCSCSTSQKLLIPLPGRRKSSTEGQGSLLLRFLWVCCPAQGGPRSLPHRSLRPSVAAGVLLPTEVWRELLPSLHVPKVPPAPLAESEAT